MEYNKNQFAKTNDKKVLHKVKKQWVVLSMSLLALLGGGAAAAHVSAHADPTNNQASHNAAQTMKQQLNQSLTKVQNNQPANQQSATGQQRQAAVNPQLISQQANLLHNRILSNASQLGSEQETAPSRQVGNSSTSAPKYSIPVTVKYLNSDGTQQYTDQKDGKGNALPKVQAVTIPDNSDSESSTVKWSDSSHIYSDLKQQLDLTGYSIDNDNSNDALKLSDIQTSFGDPSNHSDTTSLTNGIKESDQSYAAAYSDGKNWDTDNNRPIIVLKANSNKNGTIMVNYVDQNGNLINGNDANSKWSRDPSRSDSYTLSGQYGNNTNVTGHVPLKFNNGSVSENPNDSKDYTLDTNDTKVNYTVTNSPQYVTVALQGKKFAGGSSSSDQGGNNFTAHIYIKNRQGQYYNGSSWSDTKKSGTTVSDYLGGQIGGITKVTPNASWIQNAVHNLPNGLGSNYTTFDPSDSTDNVVNVKFNNDGTDDGFANIGPNSANYTFEENQDDSSQPAKGFSVKFVDPNQSNKVLSRYDFSDNDSLIKNQYGNVIHVLGQNASGHGNGASGNTVTVPAGYHLAPGQSSDYTVNDQSNTDSNASINSADSSYSVDGNTDYIYVNGDYKRTNASKNYPLNIKLHLQKFHVNVSGQLSDNGAASSDTITPSDISDRVGQSTQISANQFISDVAKQFSLGSSNVEVDSTQSTNDNLTFTPTGLQVGSNPVNSNSNTVDFYYNAYPQNGGYHRIRVHYVTPSDPHSDISTVYKSNGTPVTGQDTTVSDKGYTGATFNNRPFEESDNGNLDKTGKTGGNVPAGYQFVKVLGDNPIYRSSSDGTNSYQFGGWNGKSDKPNYQSLNQFQNNDEDEVIEVVPKVKSVNIAYINQDDDQVGTTTISGLDKNNHSRYGQVINLSDGTITPNAGINDGTTLSDVQVPYGYHIKNSDNSGETGKYLKFDQYGDSSQHATFNSTNGPNNTYYVMVAGNTDQPENSSDMAHITIHEEDANGNDTGKSYQISDNVSGNVGDKFNFYANEFTPVGYQVDNGKSSDAYGTIQTNDQISPNHFDFYYKKMVDNNNLQPIYVIFDDNGHNVGGYKVNENNSNVEDQTVNAINGIDGTTAASELPSGYQLVPGQSDAANTYFSDSHSNQVNLKVYKSGTEAAGDFVIQRQLYSDNGTNSNGYTSSLIVPESGKIGDKFKINASDYHNSVKGYTWKAGSDVNGGFTGAGIEPNNTTFQYQATNSSDGNQTPPSNPSDSGPVGPDTNHAQPIFVQFYSADSKGNVTPVRISYGNVTNSDSDDVITVNGGMNSDISDIARAAMNKVGGSSDAPRGYSLNSNQKLNYQIGTQAQMVDLDITKIPDNAQKFTLHLDYESTPNSTDNLASSDTKTIYIPNNGSDTFKASDYNANSSDYALDTNSNRDGDLTVKNNNGKLTNSSDTFYYTPTNINLQPVTISYVDQSGEVVGQNTLSGSYYGQQENAYANLPNGYTNPSGKQYYKITHTPQYGVVNVDNNNTNGRGDLTIHYTVINGNQVQSGNTSISKSGTVGSGSDIAASSIKDQVASVAGSLDGYTSTDNHDVPVTIESGGLSPNSTDVTFWKAAPNDTPSGKPDKTAGALYVHYQTPSGKDLGGGFISGKNQGDVVSDITKNTNMPNSGYNIVGTDIQPANQVPNKQYGYKFISKNPQIVDVTLKSTAAQTGSASLTIHPIEIKNNGQVVYPSTIFSTVSGTVGSDVTVNADQYTPAGYYVDPTTATATVNITGPRSITPNNVYFTYRQDKFTDAYPMYVRYFNQKGAYVGGGKISGDNNFGKTIDVTKATASANHGVAGIGSPEGYSQLAASGPNSNPDQRTSYTFDGNTHVINLNVVGNTVTKTLPIHIVEQGAGGTSSTINAQYRMQVGSDVVISPTSQVPTTVKRDKSGNYNEGDDQELTPDNYFAAAPDNKDQTVTVLPDGSLSPNDITFTYNRQQSGGSQLHLIYMNQAGNNVASKTITGSDGKSVNVESSADGGLDCPSGYSILPDQDSTYTLSDQPQTVILHIQGNSNSTPITIHKIYYHSDGKMTESDQTYAFGTQSDLVGDVDTVDPAASNIMPNGWHISNSDQPRLVTINPDGAPSPQDLTFKYYQGNAGSNNESVLRVHYINADTMQQVGDGFDVDGNIGGTTTASDITKNHLLPYGYRPVSGSTQYTFTAIPQTVNIMVHGASHLSIPLTVYSVEKDSDGTTNGTIIKHTMHTSGDSGSSVTVSPYDFSDASSHEWNHKTNSNDNTEPLTPAGYHADPSDRTLNLHIDPNGDLAPLNTITYFYSKDYQQQRIGTIVVHYYDSGTPGSNQHDVDTVQDHGLSGDNFDVKPYLNDLPDSLDVSYESNGSQATVDGTTPISNDTIQYNNNTRNVYIPVKKES